MRSFETFHREIDRGVNWLISGSMLDERWAIIRNMNVNNAFNRDMNAPRELWRFSSCLRVVSQSRSMLRREPLRRSFLFKGDTWLINPRLIMHLLGLYIVSVLFIVAFECILHCFVFCSCNLCVYTFKNDYVSFIFPSYFVYWCRDQLQQITFCFRIIFKKEITFTLFIFLLHSSILLLFYWLIGRLIYSDIQIKSVQLIDFLFLTNERNSQSR